MPIPNTREITGHLANVHETASTRPAFVQAMVRQYPQWAGVATVTMDLQAIVDRAAALGEDAS